MLPNLNGGPGWRKKTGENFSNPERRFSNNSCYSFDFLRFFIRSQSDLAKRIAD